MPSTIRNTTAEPLIAISDFIQRVKERKLAGETFNESFGILKE